MCPYNSGHTFLNLIQQEKRKFLTNIGHEVISNVSLQIEVSGIIFISMD